MIAGGIDRFHAGARNASPLKIDHEEPDIGVVRARGDDREIRDLAVGRKCLDAAQLAAPDLGPDRGGRDLSGTLDQREGPDRLSRGDFWQPAPHLGLVAGQSQQLGSEVDGGGIGDRRQRASQFLGDDAEFECPRAGSSISLGNRDAEQAEVGEALP